MTDAVLFESQARFTTEEGILESLAFIFLDDLWRRSGGNANRVIPSSLISEAVADTTTTNNQRIICTQPVTVTLNANPQDGENVFVKRTNGAVTVSGNGKNIDNNPTFALAADWDGIDMFYSAASGYWVVISS